MTSFMDTRRRRGRLLAGVAVLVLGSLAACGDDDRAQISAEDAARGENPYSATFVPAGGATGAELDTVVERLGARLDALGVEDAEVRHDGERVVVELQGVDDPGELVAVAVRPAELRFRPVLCQLPPPDAVPNTTAGDPGGADDETELDLCGSVAAGTATEDDMALTKPGGDEAGAAVTLEQREGETYRLGPASATADDGTEVPLTGSEVIDDASARSDPMSGSWTIDVELRGGNALVGFNALASSCFNVTSECPDGRAAVTLDSVVMSVLAFAEPQFESGAVSISGTFTEAEAEELALLLRTGSLSVILEIQEPSTSS